MQVLFRMVDCESGVVAIDGVDTKAIGLAALRSRLTIIPQVFSALRAADSPVQKECVDRLPAVWQAESGRVVFLGGSHELC